MYFTNDYIMRQIQIAIHGLANLLFNKENALVAAYEKGVGISSDALYHRLKARLARRQINEAENLLFEALEGNPLDSYLKTAIQFYRDLSELSDEELLRHHFSRDEILEGVVDVGRLYGLDLMQYIL